MKLYIKILYVFLLLIVTITCSSWGFFAHKLINKSAVFFLPKGMIRFYKSNVEFISEHAVDPDKRRYVDPLEAARHFLDVDRYGDTPFNNLPRKWKDATTKYAEKVLLENGTVPWQIEKTYRALVKAFQERDSLRILHFSADLGHYISDAHVPLHTTENYNGQLSNQIGIHGLWESRLPELFADQYNYWIGSAKYIPSPIDQAWNIVKNSFLFKDSVLLIEARLSKKFPPDKKHEYSKRQGRLGKQYSKEYSLLYHQALNGMVEQQIRASIKNVADFWYSAWVDAGQPNLTKFHRFSNSKEEPQLKELEKLYKKNINKPLSREEH